MNRQQRPITDRELKSWLLDIEHFTVHDMRRTARTHLAALGVDRFVAERSLNHKLGHVEGIYDRHDHFAERATALGAWAALLDGVERGTGLTKDRSGGRGATAKRPTHAGTTSGQPRSATSPAS